MNPSYVVRPTSGAEAYVTDMNEKPIPSDAPANAGRKGDEAEGRPAAASQPASGQAPPDAEKTSAASAAAPDQPADTPSPSEESDAEGAAAAAEGQPAGEAPPAAEGQPAGEGQSAAEGQPAAHAAQAGDGPPTLVIRYGRMGMLARFTYTLPRWRRGQRAVIRSDRGIETGTIVCRWLDRDDAHGGGGDLPVRGEVLRLVTHADEIDERHLEQDAEREFAFCREKIAEHTLPMKLVGVEHLFGGDRILFYFVAEKRIDFRALVRDLAREFQTRIEMRQIGVRDEARLLGDYERCGRPLCCRAFMRDLEPVSMKMAKVQKATLDPAKISGRCGRLMCCLRFEHNTYKELAKNLPRRNTEVGTPAGKGKVVDTDVVTQIVGVLLEAGTRVNVPVESLMPPEEAPTPAEAARTARAERDARNGRDAGKVAPAAAPERETPKADRPQAAQPDAGRKGDEAEGGSGRSKRSRRGRRRSRNKGRGPTGGGESGGQGGGEGG